MEPNFKWHQQHQACSLYQAVGGRVGALNKFHLDILDVFLIIRFSVSDELTSDDLVGLVEAGVEVSVDSFLEGVCSSIVYCLFIRVRYRKLVKVLLETTLAFPIVLHLFLLLAFFSLDFIHVPKISSNVSFLVE